MSDTPRTDAEILHPGSGIAMVRPEFARQLERELVAMTKNRDECAVVTEQTMRDILVKPFVKPGYLSAEKYEILYHTEHRAAGGLYCGGGKVMDELVAEGLMESAGRKSFVPDEYFGITSAGRSALQANKKA